jgi:hypothetical protein
MPLRMPLFSENRTETVGEWVYALCTLTSVACAVLLLRGYWSSRTRLLF